MPQTLPQATNDPHLLWRFPDTHRQVSCGVTVPFSWVLVNKVLLCLQGFTSQSYVSSGSSIVGLMATSSRRTYSIPTLRAPVMWQTTTDPYSTVDTQTQVCLSLCGGPGSWCTQPLFEPSEHLWQEWGLILNLNSPLLPFCWGFPFALGRGVISTWLVQ